MWSLVVTSSLMVNLSKEQNVWEVASSSPFSPGAPCILWLPVQALTFRQRLVPRMGCSSRVSALSPSFSQLPSSVQMIVPLGSLRKCCSTCEKSDLLVETGSHFPAITLRVVMSWSQYCFIPVKSFSLWNLHTLYICRHFSFSLFISQIVFLLFTYLVNINLRQ